MKENDFPDKKYSQRCFKINYSLDQKQYCYSKTYDFTFKTFFSNYACENITRNRTKFSIEHF